MLLLTIAIIAVSSVGAYPSRKNKTADDGVYGEIVDSLLSNDDDQRQRQAEAAELFAIPTSAMSTTDDDVVGDSSLKKRAMMNIAIGRPGGVRPGKRSAAIFFRL